MSSQWLLQQPPVTEKPSHCSSEMHKAVVTQGTGLLNPRAWTQISCRCPSVPLAALCLPLADPPSCAWMWFSWLPFNSCSLHATPVYHLERWLSSFGMKGTIWVLNPFNVPEGWSLILEQPFLFSDFFLLLFYWESDNLETDDPFSYHSTRVGRERINCLKVSPAVSNDQDTLCVLMLWLPTLLWLPCKAWHALSRSDSL